MIGEKFIEKGELKLLTKNKKSLTWFVVIICVIFYILFQKINLPDLSIQGKQAIAFTIIIVLLLLGDFFPLLLISLLIVIVTPILGIVPQGEVFANFASGPVFFVIGVFILAAGFIKTGFGYRLSLYVSGLLGNKPKYVVLSYMLMTGLVSSVLADIPTAIIFGALAMVLLQENNCKPGSSNFGKMLMIAVPMGATIGGIGTPAGGVVNVLTIDLIKNILGIEISFIKWTIVCFPFAFIILILAWFILCKIYTPEITEVKGLDNIAQKRKELGAMTVREKKYLVIFAIILVLWLTQTIHGLALWTIAILGTTLFFMPGIRVLEWDEVKDSINFEIAFLIGAMNVIAYSLTSSGAAEWFASYALGSFSNMSAVTMITLVSMIGIIAHYILPASSAEVMVLTPVVCMIGLQYDVSPVLLSVAICLTAHCSMLLPTGDTICLATYPYKYWTVWDMLKPTFILAILWIPVTVIVLQLASLLNIL